MADSFTSAWLPLLSQLCGLMSMILLMAAATSLCLYRRDQPASPAEDPDEASSPPLPVSAGL